MLPRDHSYGILKFSTIQSLTVHEELDALAAACY